MQYDITASIVLYENDQSVRKTINSFLATSLKHKLFLIDNSPSNKLKSLAKNNIEYIFNNKNLGFGKAHNIALRKSVDQSLYHLVLNPDIEFDEGVLEKIFDFMQLHKDAGQLLPKVFYKNGNLQKLCHLLPQPGNLISRRFFENTKWSKKLNDKYELNGFAYDKCLNIPNLSGCFMFLRCDVLKQTGLFDERYFMYMEDIDLCRRIHAISKTVFLPDVSIIHGFEKESYTNKVVLKYHIQSAIKYFNKWGWAFDKERRFFNKRILNEVDASAKQSHFKPRLLLLINRLVVGGISNDVIPLAYYLRAEFEILILHGEKEKDETEVTFLLKKYPGLTIKKLKHFKKNFNLIGDSLLYFEIKKEIKNYNPDIVHTHGAKSGFYGRLAAHSLKIHSIVHTFHGHLFHSYYNKFFTSVLKNIERRLAGITSVIIAISKSQALELSELYKIASSKKINIIPLGIDMNTMHDEENILRTQFRNKYCITDNEIIIAAVGRIAPVKNPELFIQTAALILKQKITAVRFFIIGDGYLKTNIKEACEKWNITWSESADKNADVIFTSWIENIAPALNGIDILASTSNNEGTPMSIIEAQCCGKPVVATDVGGVRDIMLDGKTGFLAEPNNAEAIAEKFKILIQDSALRNKMGLRAKAYALENFSKQKEVENYKQLYKSLLTLKKTKRSALQQKGVE